MRTGDPHIASAAKTFTDKNAPWSLPVQRSLPEITKSPDMTAGPSKPATAGVAPIVDRQQYLDGDFNTGNGGKWPSGNVKY